MVPLFDDDNQLAQEMQQVELEDPVLVLLAYNVNRRQAYWKRFENSGSRRFLILNKVVKFRMSKRRKIRLRTYLNKTFIFIG